MVIFLKSNEVKYTIKALEEIIKILSDNNLFIVQSDKGTFGLDDNARQLLKEHYEQELIVRKING